MFKHVQKVKNLELRQENVEIDLISSGEYLKLTGEDKGDVVDIWQCPFSPFSVIGFGRVKLFLNSNFSEIFLVNPILFIGIIFLWLS